MLAVNFDKKTRGKWVNIDHTVAYFINNSIFLEIIISIITTALLAIDVGILALITHIY